MEQVVKALGALLRDQSGASAAEYALILSIVGTGVVLAAIFLGNAITESMSDAATCLASDGSNC